MSEIRLSIIVPFYNVEKYISRCLDSIYAQDIPENEYEVICVNDASPDHSRDIVQAYQCNYANLKLIEHPTNRMPGAGRNSGLLASQGNYVCFIDSDDYIQANVFAKLLTIVESNDLDILHFCAQRVTDEDVKYDYLYAPIETDVTSGMAYLNDRIVSYWEKHTTAWLKLYRREFLLKNQLLFPEGVYFEDNAFSLRCLIACEKFKHIPDIVYYYRINPVSIMESNINGGKKLADRLRMYCECLNILEHYSKNLFPYDAAEIYINHIYTEIKKKSILYLPLKEKFIFYKRIRSFNKNILLKYMRFRDYFFFIYPIFVFPFAILRPLGQLKRKILK